MNRSDWSQPRRQPIAGLVIVFLNTFWEIIKRIWPFLIVILLGRESENSSSRYEIYALVFLGFTIISSILNFIFFRFYIEDEKLIIKKGWFKKETRVIPFHRIQTVNIEQGPLHQLLNIVKLSIDTAGSKTAEATINALHKSMAEELRSKLGAAESRSTEADEEQEPVIPIIRLNGKDLLKLSISANHLEAFFILLSFGIGLYENLKNIDDSIFSGMQDLVPRSSVFPILMLAVFILVITIIVSSIRIFLQFWNFRVIRNASGFSIQSGLTNVKNRLVALEKIQYVSWNANWIRKLMDLWMLEYHVAGADQTKTSQRVQLPVTNRHYIGTLATAYYPIPLTEGKLFIRIHPSFVFRRTLVTGGLPAFLLVPLTWLLWQEKALWFLLIPLIVFVISSLARKKFRLWAMDEVLYISKGILGAEYILMQWHKIQSVQLSQSIFQRRKNLATLTLHTAGGSIKVPFIDLEAARQILNYSVYITESSGKNWH